MRRPRLDGVRRATVLAVPVGVLVALVFLAPPRFRLLVAVAELVILGCVLIFPRLIVPVRSPTAMRDVEDPKERRQLEDDRLKLQNDVRASLLQAVTGAGVVFSLIFTWQQLQNGRDQSNAQLDLTRRGQISERFTKAVEQLGSEKLDVRVGGIYGLEQIARESGENRLVTFEVLSAYVRQHAPWTPSSEKPLNLVPSTPSDVQAAITVLGRRVVAPDDPPLDLQAVDLRRAGLFGAHLERALLSGVHLEGAFLFNTHLEGAFLPGAQLDSAFVWGAHLVRANLDVADLQNAQLPGSDLTGAHLADANLAGTEFQAKSLSPGQFAAGYSIPSSGLLTDATLRGAELRGATATANTMWPSGFDWASAGVVMRGT